MKEKLEIDELREILIDFAKEYKSLLKQRNRI